MRAASVLVPDRASDPPENTTPATAKPSAVRVALATLTRFPMTFGTTRRAAIVVVPHAATARTHALTNPTASGKQARRGGTHFLASSHRRSRTKPAYLSAPPVLSPGMSQSVASA